MSVRDDPVGDPDEDCDQSCGEGEVSPPVDARHAPGAQLAQLQPGPHSPEDPDGDRDEEDEPPVDRREKTAEDESDERAGYRGDAVDSEGEAALDGLGRRR